ncbi:MAG: preprotein translocase subunit YajC [Ruminiclostridium sp.]|nr:preprotein translocase subunit YajC [Ruminiclostridium sp.]
MEALRLLAATAADPTGGAGNWTSILITVVPLALMLVVFYFLLIRPEKKRAKTEKEMRENLQVADEVVTIGGIIGRVLSIQDETVVVETGSDRNRIRVLKTAIAENRTAHDDVEKVTIKK